MASPAIASSAIAEAAGDTPPQARAEEAPEEFLMHAMALPRGPRPDFAFVLLVSMLIASGIAFFSVLSNVHASELPALRAASIITGRIDPMPEMAISIGSARFTPVNIGHGGARSTFDAGGLHVGGALDVNGDPVVTRQQLAMLMPGNPLDAYGAIAGAAIAASITGVAGWALGALCCGWAMRRYAIVGFRARRWARDSRAALERERARQARSVYR